MDIKSWSEGVAEIVVDALKDAGLLKGDFDQAVAIVAEELFIRLTLGDYPPTVVPDASDMAQDTN